jgi:hypothetical protein
VNRILVFSNRTYDGRIPARGHFGTDMNGRSQTRRQPNWLPSDISTNRSISVAPPQKPERCGCSPTRSRNAGHHGRPVRGSRGGDHARDPQPRQALYHRRRTASFRH